MLDEAPPVVVPHVSRRAARRANAARRAREHDETKAAVGTSWRPPPAQWHPVLNAPWKRAIVYVVVPVLLLLAMWSWTEIEYRLLRLYHDIAR